MRPHRHVRAALALAAAGTLSMTTIVAARAPASTPAPAPTPMLGIQVHDPTLRYAALWRRFAPWDRRCGPVGSPAPGPS